MPMSEARLDEFLTEGTKLAVVSTVDRRGHPRSAPVWYEWRDGSVLIFTGRASLKWRNLQRVPRASICVDERETPYAGVVIDGPVEEVTEDEDPIYQVALRMATRYYGDEEGRAFAEPYRDGSPGRSSSACGPSTSCPGTTPPTCRRRATVTPWTTER